LIDWIDCLT